MLAEPPSSTAANPVPVSITLSLAPIRSSMSAAKNAPGTPISSDRAAPTQIACPVTRAAASRSPAPMRLATIAVTPMPSPTATAYSTVIRASVMPTAAMASVPRRETKAMSTTANTDSIDISSIIGMASRPSARLIGPLV